MRASQQAGGVVGRFRSGAREAHRRTCAGSGRPAAWVLGLNLDAARNEAADGDAKLTSAAAAAATLVISTRDDLEIARQVRFLLAS